MTVKWLLLLFSTTHCVIMSIKISANIHGDILPSVIVHRIIQLPSDDIRYNADVFAIRHLGHTWRPSFSNRPRCSVTRAQQ